MAEPSTALAERDVTDERIRQQIQVNRKPGFDLATATPDQLHLLYVFCKEAALLPVLHVTLYQGKPWVLLDGRIELAKRHPEYRGFRTRPLTKDEKQAWMFESTDIVVECTMRTDRWGDITARGRVARSEIDAALRAAGTSGKRPAPIGTHPQEIAEKRAIGRAERLAFGQSVPDFEDDGDERTLEQVKNGSAEYLRVFGTEDDDAPVAGPVRAPDPPAVTVNSALGQRLAELVEEAARLEVEYEDCTASLPALREEVIRKIERLEDRIERKKRRLAGLEQANLV